jgi:hypothetical protein
MMKSSLRFWSEPHVSVLLRKQRLEIDFTMCTARADTVGRFKLLRKLKAKKLFLTVDSIYQY